MSSKHRSDSSAVLTQPISSRSAKSSNGGPVEKVTNMQFADAVLSQLGGAARYVNGGESIAPEFASITSHYFFFLIDCCLFTTIGRGTQ